MRKIFFVALIIFRVAYGSSFLTSNNSLEEKSDFQAKDYLFQEEKKDVGEMPLPDSEIIDPTKYNTDNGYKIFYGEWEATKKLGDCYRLDVQDISDIIGTKLVFTIWNCHYYYDGREINIDYPTYNIVIIPLNEDTTYLPYMPTLTELGFTGEYVVIFNIDDGEDVYVMVKDDETLVMFYKDAYVELKRTKYIWGHKSCYKAP